MPTQLIKHTIYSHIIPLDYKRVNYGLSISAKAQVFVQLVAKGSMEKLTRQLLMNCHVKTQHESRMKS